MRRRRSALAILAAAAALPLLALPLSASGSAPDEPAAAPPLTAAFRDASGRYGVPEQVLLALSYAQTRWDDHGAHPSTSGGYGLMHLTDVDARTTAETADGTRVFTSLSDRLHTLDTAARLIGRDSVDLRLDPAANVAGGAALLAEHQRSLGLPVGAETDLGQWYGAVALYSGATEARVARVFADDVYKVLSEGAARTTNGGQSVALAADPAVVPDRGQLARTGLRSGTADEDVECPEALACEWLPAPYQPIGDPALGDYGNHDKGDRPNTGKIDYIIIHDTEGGWQGTLNLVQDPNWVSWQDTMRSADGKTWQHLKHNDVAWQAGNWYVNMHSIGIEHEGRAAQGATWYTEVMYRNSARLVRYLAHQHRIPLDRAHIIGHDQVPGTIPSTVRGMHWDPGPYWDWEHYFTLLGAPIRGSHRPVEVGDIVTIKPGFDGNQQVITGCNPDGTCAPQGSNFVYLRQAPDDAAPLVKDIGLRPDGSNSTTRVSDIGARAGAGYRFVVADRSGEWLAIWYLGAKGWFRNPAGAEADALASTGLVVEPKPGRATVPVYGRAYPEASAYPAGIPVQAVTPLQYSIGAGQAYPVGDAWIQTDYYRATVYNGAPPTDRVQVLGNDRYYQIWFGHRMAYVRAADVDLSWSW
jgi:N-acetylmuramoyl-L-alanine amidase